VNEEYRCYGSEFGDADSGNGMEVLVIKTDEILTYTE
jgi:hypothetical protein